MPRGLGPLLLLLVILSCTSGTRFDAKPTVSVVELGPSERAEAQRRSLRHVFYRNNEAPPPPTAAELRRLDRDLALAPPVEVQELRDLFGEDYEMLAFATRDTDGDGVLDYRISEYRGKFFEGDIDIDGDGIRNVYDSAPYDPKVGGVDTTGDGIPDKPGSFADRDGDGIPDHLDWSRRKPSPLPELQEALFRDFGVILVERSARFSPELVHAVDDTLRLVFRERLPTLRTIAVEDQLLISPDLGDNGFMLAQTQTLTVYTKSLEGAAPVVLLGLMIHEVGHAWQLAQDFNANDLAAENVKMHFPPGRFTRSLERFGWEVDHNTLAAGYHHRLYWPHFYATSPRYHYRGSSPHEWATWFEDVQRESGTAFLRNSPAVTWGMVGPYSLTSPWEWHADHLMAALYNRMDRGVNEHDNRIYRNIAGLLRKAMLEAVQSQWSRFDYRNAVGTGIDRELGRRFALTRAEVDHLVDRYVIPLADFPMLSEALARESASPDSFGGPFRASVGAALDDLRDRTREPLRRRPDLHSLIQVGFSPWRGQDRLGSRVAGPGLEGFDSVGADPDEQGWAPGWDPGGDADWDETWESDRELARELSDDDKEALANPDIDLVGLGVDEPPARSGPRWEADARTSLSNERGGAGYVGGIALPRDRDRDWPAPAAGADLDHPGAARDERAGEPGREGARSTIDPLAFLFDQLRRVAGPVPEAEESDPDPDPELDPDSDSEPDESTNAVD